jgi:hypothetical protein
VSILDDVPFSFEEPDAKTLLKFLLDTYPDRPAVREFADGAGLPPASVNWEQAMKDAWPDVLVLASRERKIRVLIEAVRAKGVPANPPEYPELFARLLTPIAGAVIVPPQDNGLPYAVHLVGSTDRPRPFIDRVELRANLKELVSDRGVLVVNGPAASGKSYSWHFIAYVRDALQSFDSYVIDLGNWVGTPAGPIDIMKEIATQLDWEPAVPDAEAQEDTLARTLLTWFKSNAKRAPAFWIVLDGVDRAPLTDGALRLIDGIATAAGRAEAGEARVVLLDYRRPLPLDVDPYVLQETLDPIGVDTLRTFFVDVGEQHGVTLASDVVDDLMTKLLGNPPYPDPLPIATVAPKAGRLAQLFFSTSGGGGGNG